jgi:hypothetical protein
MGSDENCRGITCFELREALLEARREEREKTLRGTVVMELVNGLKDICRGCDYGVTKKDLYNKAAAILTNYRQAMKAYDAALKPGSVEK